MMQYKDFVIDLMGYNDITREFSVRVNEMPCRDAHAPNYAEPSQLPEELLELQAELALGTLQCNKIERFGNLLFEALLPKQGGNSTRDLFRQAHRNLDKDHGLRLCLRFGQTDLALASIAWEYLWVEGEGTPLLLDRKCSMARVEVLAGERQGNLTTPVNIRMLGLFANPTSTEVLDLNKDVESLKKLHQKLPDRIQQTLVPSTANPSQKITRSWLRQFFVDHGDVQILHFSGHGYVITRMADEVGKLKQEGGLILLKEDSTADFCPAANIAGYLADQDVRLVVLSACEGARRDAFNPWQTVATALIGRGIPAVIGMQFEIADAHAIVFNQAFYHALASGLSIDEAVWAARWAIWDCELPEDSNAHLCAFGIAALYLRGEGDLILFPRNSPKVDLSSHPHLIIIYMSRDEFIQECKRVFSDCDEFQSRNSLHAMFSNNSDLRPFRSRLREGGGNSVTERIQLNLPWFMDTVLTATSKPVIYTLLLELQKNPDIAGTKLQADLTSLVQFFNS